MKQNSAATTEKIVDKGFSSKMFEDLILISYGKIIFTILAIYTSPMN